MNHATLLDAARELLEMLERYVAYFDDYDEDGEFPECQAMKAAARAVIAKSRGVV